MFAPGHVGELTQVIPTELVDAVLEETGTRERRLRSLPSRVGVYFGDVRELQAEVNGLDGELWEALMKHVGQ